MLCNQNWSCYPCIMVCEYSYYEFDIKSMHIKIYACAILGTRAIKCMLYQSFEIMQNSFFRFVFVKVCMNMCRMCMWGYIYLRLCKFSMDSCINEDNQNWHGMYGGLHSMLPLLCNCTSKSNSKHSLKQDSLSINNLSNA